MLKTKKKILFIENANSLDIVLANKDFDSYRKKKKHFLTSIRFVIEIFSN